MNIYDLAQIIIDGTACRPTIPLCTRVALMVSIKLYFRQLLLADTHTISACNLQRDQRWGQLLGRR